MRLQTGMIWTGSNATNANKSLQSYQFFETINPVMKETTRAHIRNQASNIENITGMVDVLSQTDLVDKAHIQLRLDQLKQRLETISDSLREIEQSESLEWLEDKAGINA